MDSVNKTFVGLAKKYNHFEDKGFETPTHSCHVCLRKHFSYPYTCNDGWHDGNSQWKDLGSRCLNWTDNKHTKVD